MTNRVEGAEKFRGSMVALVTPFNKDYTVDFGCLKDLVEWQIQRGIHVIVPCGTTGESNTLSNTEHDLVIEKVVEYVDGRIPVLAGTGSNATWEAVDRTKHARSAGADGALLIEPYCNKPQERNVVKLYYGLIAEAVPGFPLVIYHVPGRTAGKLSVDSVCRLSELPEYIGIKEASGKIERTKEIIARCSNDFAVFSGEDALNLDIYREGGKGAISVTANVVPDMVANVWNLYAENKLHEAEEAQARLQQLNKAMFIDGNPASVKTALHIMGRVQPYMKPPLGLAEGKEREFIYDTLKAMNIIN